MEYIALSTNASFGPKDALVLRRAELDIRSPPLLHSQDFYELVWVQNGTVRLCINGNRRNLTECDLMFISPNQLHGLQGRQPKKVSEHTEPAMVVSLAI